MESDRQSEPEEYAKQKKRLEYLVKVERKRLFSCMICSTSAILPLSDWM